MSGFDRPAGCGRSPVARMLAAVALAWVLAASAQAQPETWELRVCADPNALPFSDREEPGFENRIAEILAEHLDASLAFEWYPQTDAMYRRRFRTGACDVVMGVPDGHEGTLTTLAYYRSPYVFVSRSDRELDLEGLDDPRLEDLRIGTQSTDVPPYGALVARGLAENVVAEYGPRRYADVDHPLAPVVQAVVDGSVDVGLAWGPVAGFYAQRAEADLTLQPVTPAFDPPFRTMVTPMTLGVRPGDVALRDRLEETLVAHWDEVQAVLREYGVPRGGAPPPAAPAADGADGTFRVGLVAPSDPGGPTEGDAALFEVIGQAAHHGALLAEDDAAREVADAGFAVDVLQASSPDPEAAARAARRLVATEGVDALVGGVGAGQAERVRAVARAAEVPFFNVGSPRASLRQQCDPFTLHVEASASMYLGATVRWFGREGAQRWYVVHEDDEAGRARLERARRAVMRTPHAGRVVGSRAVPAGVPTYADAYAAAEAAEADVILALLPARDQGAFYAQLANHAIDARVVGFPTPVTQTREFLATLGARAPELGGGVRMALWDTTLEQGFAGRLNDRFTSRFGQPMDPSAWAAYQAVTLAVQARAEVGPDAPHALVAHLLDPETRLETGKGVGVSFRAADRQLRQPLYAVQIDPEAEWGRELSQRMRAAVLRGRVPEAAPGAGEAQARAALDRLDEGGDRAVCGESGP